MKTKLPRANNEYPAEVIVKQKILNFSPQSMGDPRRSIKELRDSLARHLSHNCAIVAIPTENGRGGYLLITDYSFTFTGDGFCRHAGGEAEVAWLAAQSLFTLFRKDPMTIPRMDFKEVMTAFGKGSTQKATSLLRQMFEEIAGRLEESSFSKSMDFVPGLGREPSSGSESRR